MQHREAFPVVELQVTAEQYHLLCLGSQSFDVFNHARVATDPMISSL